MKIKQYRPYLFMFLAFVGFLVVQFSLDEFPLMAKESPSCAKKKSIYEQEYLNSSFPMPDKSSTDLKLVHKDLVILNFWASWCTPCLKEFPSLVRFYDKYKENAFVLGVNNDEESPKKTISKIKKKYKLNFDSAMDPNSEITSNIFKVLDIPTTLVFYKGKLAHCSEGDMNFMKSSFIKKIDRLLKK